jgi:hypothetical protein
LTRAVREAGLAALLGVLPALAFLPALREGRLLAPGDGAAFHYPLRRAAWQSWPEPPSWNPTAFGGEPLLASYRVGALYPPGILLGLLEPFRAFNALVLLSLGAAAAATYFYLRATGAEAVGAFFGGLAFGLGPYLVDHLEDSASIFAAPTLPLVLLALEVRLRQRSRGSAAALSGALALLLLSGSPETVGATLLLLGVRLVLGTLDPEARRRPGWGLTFVALAAGVLLAAPQILPSLLALRDAGRGTLGFAGGPRDALPGLTGRILRYVSHTPAPSLALAALPLAWGSGPIRGLFLSLGLVLGLQWGRGPLAAPGSLSMAFDFCLAALAGLALSVLWRKRRERGGFHLRAYFLFAVFASALALSISAAALGPLPDNLSSAVGILAFSLILFFSLAASAKPLRAGVFLLPLTVSFLLQPRARGVWERAPTRSELEVGTPSAAALTRALGTRGGSRGLALVRRFPRAEEGDLLYGNRASLAGRRTLNGYDPMVPERIRRGLGGMSSAGFFPGAFFRSDPTRLEVLGVQWAEIPSSALVSRPDPAGLGETLDIRLEVGRPRYFPLPMTPATQIRIASHLSGATRLEDDTPVARVKMRLASGRDVELLLRAGRDTAEWAYDRPDVAPSVRHRKARVLEPLVDPTGFAGHQYLGILDLPGRFFVDGLGVERLPTEGELTLARIGVTDVRTESVAPVSLAAGYVSDEAHFSPLFETPAVRLFELPQTLGLARVTERLRVLPGDESVESVLNEAEQAGFDPRHETLVTEADAGGLALPPASVSSRAEVARSEGPRLALEAVGPGLLVLAENWDRGWRAHVDGKEVSVVRVNGTQMGAVLGPGPHFVEFRHHARGFGIGLALAFLGGVGILVLRERS